MLLLKTTMMIPAEMVKMLSEQICLEMAASQAYLKASMWFESKHLPGLGRLMRQQSDDERQHGLRILDHMLLRRVDLLKIDIDKMVPEFNPDIKQWNDAVDVASSVEAFENMMSERLIALVRAARESGDVETEAFLMPLVSEQTAETSETIALVEKIKTFSVMPGLIYHLDTQV